MNQAEQFISEVIRCDDNPVLLKLVFERFTKDISKVLLTGNRSHNIHFKDGSIVEKSYEGDEVSTFHVHAVEQ